MTKPPNPRGVPKQHGRKPPNPQRAKQQHGRKPLTPGRVDGKNPGDCCPMVAAVRSVRRGKVKLARRYAILSIRLIAARIA